MLIAHLSDLHLCPDGTLYQGVLDTAPRLAEALAKAAAFAPDLLLLSGDLTEDGDAASYARLCDMLSGFPAPILAIPGNHDDRETFRTGLRGLADMIPLAPDGPLHSLMDGPVRVIGFDVTVPGQHHGLVTADHAHWLDCTLAAAPDTPTLIVTHQPPYSTGMAFIDDYRCFGEDHLARVLSRHPQVMCLLSGHVHRFTLTSFADRPALTAPAIATSIALRLAPGADPASVTEPPSMLLHHWTGEELVTHLQPVGAFPGPYAFF